MRFGKVDIPEQLVEARRKGNLAVFAGAGVSVGPPSNLPGFDELVERVAQDTPDIDPEDRNQKRFDRFLGELHRGGEGVNVHEIVRREIDNPESEPSPLHYELIRLFDNASEVRLVTTNFDRHFTTAAQDHFHDNIPHYYAPALPPGDNFSGITYLHGSVEQDPDKLVLTDEDFSQAYITKGWARRFLQRLFSNYYVLFVGYSHGEAVIEYLARGLPATDDQGRLALDKGWEDSNGEPTQWEYFDIEPIEYPKAEGDEDDHAELPKALKIWNRYSRQTAREQAEHIRTLVEKEPTKLNEQEEDALKDRLGTRQEIRRFATEATSRLWLHWAFREGYLDGLFQPGELSVPEDEFARWIGSQLIPRFPEVVLSLVGPKADRLNPKFWNRIVRGIWNNEDPEVISPEKLAEWVQLLLISPPPHPHNLSLLLSDGLRMPEDHDAALLLFEHLTEPIADFQEGYKHPDSNREETEPRAQHRISVRDPSAQLPRAWEDVLRPHLSEIAEYVEEIVTANLRRLYRLYDSAGQTRPNGETPVSIHRSAIETHPQDEQSSRQEGEYVLIDAARDSIEWLLENQPGRASAIIQTWSASEIPLLERLSVHAMTEDSQVDSNAKIQWLLDRDWLYTPRLKYEVFHLLEEEYPDASKPTREALLERAGEEWPSEGKKDREGNARKVYNLIQWLADHTEKGALVEDRLEEIQSEFPNFTPREHPDLNFWVGEVRAIEPEDYSEELLRHPPADQLDRLLEILESKYFAKEDAPDTSDVQTAIAKEFGWGFELIEELEDRSKWNEEVWSPIWRGLKETSLEDEEWECLLTFIRDHSAVHSHANGLASLLEQRSKPDTGDLPVEHLSAAERIADSVYEASRDDPTTVGGDADLATRLLNHPGASIAFFYVYSLWTRNEVEDLSGLPEEYRDRFETILSENNRAAWAGQMVLGSRLSFLHQVAEEWTLDHLLPHLAWDEKEIGRMVWTGILFMGQSLSPALAQECKEVSRNAFSQVSEESDDFRDRFAGFVASLSLSDAIDPLEEQWLSQYLVETEEDRTRWTKRMATRLRKLGSDRVEEVWHDWLHEFWRLRLDGKPSLTSREMGAMMEWIPSLEPVIEEAVALAREDGVPSPRFGQHTQLFYEIDEQELGFRHPHSVTRLLHFVLSEGENLQRWDTHGTQDILEDIASAEECPPEEFEQLVDQCVELGLLESDKGRELIEQC